MARAFGYKVYIVPILSQYIDLAQIALHEEANTGLAASGFIDRTTIVASNEKIRQRGLGLDQSYYITLNETTHNITNAELASNVATLTIGTHTKTVGNRVVVAGLTTPFTSLNGNYVITAVTGTTISYAKTGSNITSASTSAGTASVGSDLKLDGTDKPFRILGLESGPFTSDTNTESDPIWDDESLGFETGEPVSKTGSMAFSGKADLADPAYQVMRLCEKGSVARSLVAKLARIGPTGYNEVTFGYGRFDGFQESNDAGTVVKWSSDFTFYGPHGLNLHR